MARPAASSGSAPAPIGTWECDLATGRLTWSDAVFDLFGLPRGCMLERARIVELYDAPSRSMMEEFRDEAIRFRSCFTLDADIHTATGVPRRIRLTADVACAGSRVVRLFGTKREVTDRTGHSTASRFLR